MKELKTVQEKQDWILNRINEFQKNCIDTECYIKHISRVKTAPGFLLTEPCNEGPPFIQELPFSGYSEGQLLSSLGIPAGYLHKCSDQVQAENVNHWTVRYPKKKILLRRHTDSIRGVVSPRYSRDLDDHQVFPQILETIKETVDDPENIHYRDFHKTENFTYLVALFKDLDSIHGVHRHFAGITIINSEVKRAALWIKPVIFGGTPAHTYNYLDSSHEGSTRFIHIGQIEEGAIKAAIVSAKDVAQVGIHRLLETKQEIITNPKEEIEVYMRNSETFGNKLAKVLKEEYKDNRETSKFNFAQSILHSVKDLPVFQKYQIELDVGRYLNLFSTTKARAKTIIQDS